MDITIVNLTPHKLNTRTETGDVVTVEPSGSVARVSVNQQIRYTMKNGILVYAAKYGDTEGLPGPSLSTIYIASGMVESATNRTDVFAPGNLILDGDGRVIGCDGLKQT